MGRDREGNRKREVIEKRKREEDGRGQRGRKEGEGEGKGKGEQKRRHTAWSDQIRRFSFFNLKCT